MNQTDMATVSPANATEEKLLEAGLTLFSEKGYAATPVREIIEAAGVTRPVLYYYCENKADLFCRIVRWKHEDAYRTLAEQLDAAATTRQRLSRILHGSFRFCAADPRVPRLMFQTAYGPLIPGISEFIDGLGHTRFSIVRDVVEQGVNDQELRGDIDTISLMFCCLMDHHIQVLSRSPNPEELLTEALADRLLEMFLHGVSARSPKVEAPAG